MNSNHPIIRNYHSRMLYVGIWALITGAQTLAVTLTTGLPLGYALIDALVFNIILACCVIPLWYPISYNRWKDQQWHLNLNMHGVLVVLLLSFWLGVGYLLMHFLLGWNEAYIDFLKVSILWKIIEGLLFYIVVVLVYYLYIYVERLNEKANNEIHLTKLLKDSELNLLKSQINPHFLFNSLNSVNALIIKAPEQAQEMLVSLSDYLRYTVLATRQENANLQEEIENIERYLSIEKLRFGDKLDYTFDIAPDCLSVKIPSMLLQPLFENAIKHGVYESTETVCIAAKIHQSNDDVSIEISNDFDPENLSQRKGSGTGLKNIRERLRLSYGTAASLQTRIHEGKYTAILNIPMIMNH